MYFDKKGICDYVKIEVLNPDGSNISVELYNENRMDQHIASHGEFRRT